MRKMPFVFVAVMLTVFGLGPVTAHAQNTSMSFFRYQ